MPDSLKDRYNKTSLSKLAADIQAVYRPFRADAFLQSTMDETWDQLELKDRVYHISSNLGEYLPSDYGEAIGVIDQVLMNDGTWLEGFGGFFPIFVKLFGQDEKQVRRTIVSELVGRFNVTQDYTEDYDINHH